MDMLGGLYNIFEYGPWTLLQQGTKQTANNKTLNQDWHQYTLEFFFFVM